MLGTLIVALGLAMYTQARLVTGSMAGLALLVHHITGWGFGPVFAVMNLPFCAFAWLRMGWRLVARTALALLLLGLFSRLTLDWVGFAHLDPLYAAIAGGALMGIGLLVLFRHHTGLGGVNILAMYLQERRGWRAGYVLLGFDAAVMLASSFVLAPEGLLFSVLGAAVLNSIIAINHRPGRYRGMSW
nr:YitT family protein [Roseomonas sp. GC11]